MNASDAPVAPKPSPMRPVSKCVLGAAIAGGLAWLVTLPEGPETLGLADDTTPLATALVVGAAALTSGIGSMGTSWQFHMVRALSGGVIGLQFGSWLGRSGWEPDPNWSIETALALALGGLLVMVGLLVSVGMSRKSWATAMGWAYAVNDQRMMRMAGWGQASEGVALGAAAWLVKNITAGDPVLVPVLVLVVALVVTVWTQFRSWQLSDELMRPIWTETAFVAANVFLLAGAGWLVADALLSIGTPGLLGMATLYMALYVAASFVVVANRAPFMLDNKALEEEA